MHTNFFLKIITPAAAASLSGIMMFAAFPSYDLSFLAWFGLVPLLLALLRSRPMYGFLLSLIFSVIFYTGVFYWMFDLPGYRIIHHAVLGIYLCPLMGILGWVVCATARRRGVTAALFTAPFLWVIQEYVRSNLSFLSLPWGLLAHSQYQSPAVIQLASITGVYGISFLIVLVNCALTALVYTWFLQFKLFEPETRYRFSPNGRNLLVGITAGLLVVVLLYGYMVVAAPITGHKIKISLIQANIEQSKKWDEKYAAVIMQIYSELTKRAAEDRPDLIVWPEAATPKGAYRNPGIFNRIKALAQQTGTPILIGSSQLAKYKVTDPKKNAKYLNSAFLIDPSPGKSLPQRYDKIVLLPFSEYIPYKNKIAWSYLHIPDVDNFLKGKKHTIFSLPPYRFGVTICWENIFADNVRQFIEEGAQFVINLTNEAWFGKSSAPYQFLSMSVFRAVENKVFVVRCTNTGISCLIDPCGRIVNRLKDKSGRDIFIRGVLTGDVIPHEQKTIYLRYGDWLAWLCVLAAGCSVFITLLRRKSVS